MGYIIDGIKNKSFLGYLLGWNDYYFNGEGGLKYTKDSDKDSNKSVKKSAKEVYDDALSEGSSVSPGDSGLSSSLSALLGAYKTSAIKAETEAIDKQYEINRNLIDYAFQKSQCSAREQMDFQVNQADLAWQRSLSSANSQMAFQKDMLKHTMDYNERMSSTAYQRVMKDLKSAGLNPILAFSNGSSSSPTATVPSGASASAQAMSGASASASALSSTKADYSSAKKADIADITGSLLSSAGKLIKKLF